MKFSNLIFVTLLFLGGGLAGWILSPSHSEEGPPNPEVTTSSRTITPRSASNGRFDEQMQAIRSTEDQGQRLRLTMELARTIPKDQITTWLDQGLFTRREGFAIALFSRLLEQRLMTEDPAGYLTRQLQNSKDISEENMLNFTGEHLELFLTQARSLSSPGSQISALRNLARVRADLALYELETMSDGKLMQTGDVPGVLRQIAKSDLSFLQAKLDDLPLTLRSYAREAVYRQLLEDDFSGTLDKLLKMPDGLSLLSSNFDLSEKNRQLFLSRFASLPQSWRDKLSSSSYRFTGRMEPREILAKDWASFGLSTEQIAGMTGMALYSQTRGNKEKAIDYYQQAQLDPAGARRFLDLLRNNGGRETIAELLPHLNERDRSYVHNKLGSEEQILNPPDQPKTAADLANSLAQLKPNRFSRISYSMKKWSTDQRAQVRTDYAAMQGEPRDRITAMLASDGELDLKSKAILEIFKNPEIRDFVEWDQNRFERNISEVAVELLMTDTDRAVSWVQNLPAGNARAWAIKNVANNWRNYEPNRANEFLKSFSEAERETGSDRR